MGRSQAPGKTGILSIVSSQSPALCLHAVDPRERVLPAPIPCHPGTDSVYPLTSLRPPELGEGCLSFCPLHPAQ